MYNVYEFFVNVFLRFETCRNDKNYIMKDNNKLVILHKGHKYHVLRKQQIQLRNDTWYINTTKQTGNGKVMYM